MLLWTFIGAAAFLVVGAVGWVWWANRHPAVSQKTADEILKAGAQAYSDLQKLLNDHKK